MSSHAYGNPALRALTAIRSDYEGEPMDVFIMLARRPAPQPKVVMAATIAALERRGCRVQLGYEEALYNLAALPQADVYVVKSRSAFWHSMATALHYQGKRMVNPFAALMKTQDKVVTAALLASGGVPVPEAWLTSAPLALQAPLGEGALLIKPRTGHRGQGIRWLTVEHDLDDLCLDETVHVAQHSLPVSGPVLKVYGIGEALYAFQKSGDDERRGTVGEWTQVGDEVREIVLRCRRLLDLQLYGVDIVYSGGRPWVIDVNLYPGFRGIPEAPEKIADLITTVGVGLS